MNRDMIKQEDMFMSNLDILFLKQEYVTVCSANQAYTKVATGQEATVLGEHQHF